MDDKDSKNSNNYRTVSCTATLAAPKLMTKSYKKIYSYNAIERSVTANVTAFGRHIYTAKTSQ